MTYEIGHAYVTILPSMQQFKKQFGKEMGKYVPAEGKKTGEKYGSSMMSSAGKTAKKWAKRTLIGAVASAGALAGTALTTGFQRSIKIENAQATLKGLGYNQKDIQGIMDQALGAVKGTAFGLDEAVTISSGALAAGVKDVEGYLKSVGDVATITGRDMSSIGGIFNKIMANNRLSGEEMNQLADSGIPILQLIQEEYGVTAEEARKMVSGGKVAADDFLSMMKTYEGAALESGNTTQGAFNNMRAALARLGQSALEQVFPLFKKGFMRITGVLDWATANVGSGIEKMQNFFGNMVKSDAVQGFLKLFRGEGTGMLANVLGVDQGHPIIKSLQRVRDFVKVDIPNGFETLKGVVQGVFNIFTNQGTGLLAKTLGVSQDHWIIDVFQTLRRTAGDLFGWIMNVGIPAFAGLLGHFKLSSDAGSVLSGIFGRVWESVKTLGGTLRDLLVPIFRDVWGIINNYVIPVFKQIVDFVVRTLVPDLLDAFQQRILPAVVELAAVFKDAWNRVIRPALEGLWKFIRDILWPFIVDFYHNGIKPTFDLIGKIIEWVWTNVIKPTFTALIDSLADVGNQFNIAKDRISKAWNAVKDVIAVVWTAIRIQFNKFKDGVNGVKTAFDKAVDGIGRAWDSLRNLVSKPINAVINFVNSHFIGNFNKLLEKIGAPAIPLLAEVPILGTRTTSGTTTGRVTPAGVMLAAGGPVPGWSPHDKADNIPAWLTAGEYVLPVQATERLRAALGEGGLESLRRGQLPAYANGGPVGDYDKPSRLERIGGWITERVSDLFGGAKKIWDNLIERITGSMPGGMFGEMGIGLLKKGGSSIQDFIMGLFGGGDGKGKPVAAGMGWQGIWGLVKSLFPDAILTSSVRNSTTAGYGTKSLHASGRAIDFVLNPWSRMVDATKVLSSMMGWTELIHTPAGMAQQSFGKPFANFLPITKQQHYDHVHAALADGGYVPNLYDNGGAIPPGLSLVANKTGKPEQVLTDSQWQDVQKSGGNTIVINGVKTDNASHVAEEVLFAQRRMGYGKYYRNR